MGLDAMAILPHAHSWPASPGPLEPAAVLREQLSHERRFGLGEDIPSLTGTGLLVVFEGVVGQCTWAAPGIRRITGLLVGGDLSGGRLPSGCDGEWFTALAPCRVAVLTWARADRLVRENPGVGHALWLAADRWVAIQREWLRNDARPADVRLAHRICEVATRAGIHPGPSVDVELPRIRQATWADMTAITLVHVNRCLRRVAEAGLITVTRGVVTVLDPKRLADFAGFDASYLQLGTTPLQGLERAVAVPEACRLKSPFSVDAVS